MTKNLEQQLLESLQQKLNTKVKDILDTFDPTSLVEDSELNNKFDLIEMMVDEWAAHHEVNTDEIWADLELVEDDELYETASRWFDNQVKEGLKDPKDNPCWKGYKPVGTKKKGGKTVPNCVPKESIEEDWNKVNKHDKTDGLSQKAVNAYRREHPGSKLKTAVTTKPSKLKKGSKASKRRKSFCSRMKGMKKHRAGAKTKRDPNSPINKALRRWHC